MHLLPPHAPSSSHPLVPLLHTHTHTLTHTRTHCTSIDHRPPPTHPPQEGDAERQLGGVPLTDDFATLRRARAFTSKPCDSPAVVELTVAENMRIRNKIMASACVFMPCAMCMGTRHQFLCLCCVMQSSSRQRACTHKRTLQCLLDVTESIGLVVRDESVGQAKQRAAHHWWLQPLGH
jgi:hypothetical protein